MLKNAENIIYKIIEETPYSKEIDIECIKANKARA